MINSNLQTPEPKTMERGTQTEEESSALYDSYNSVMRTVKYVSVHNFVLDVDELQARENLIHAPRKSFLVMVGASALPFTACCTMAGCYFGSSYSVIFGQAMVGLCCGLQVGHLVHKKAEAEARRIENHNNETTGSLPPPDTSAPVSLENGSEELYLIDAPPAYTPFSQSGSNRFSLTRECGLRRRSSSLS